MNDVMLKFRAEAGLAYDGGFLLVIRGHTRSGFVDPAYGGRRAKLLSTVAGHATARFQYHLCRYVLPEEMGYGPEVRAMVGECDGEGFGVRLAAGEEEDLHKVLVGKGWGVGATTSSILSAAHASAS